MTDSLKLVLGKKAADGQIPVTLTAPDGVVTPGSVDLAPFAGPWTLDAIHAKLNDRNDRQQAEAIGKRLCECLVPTGTPIRAAWDQLTAAHPLLPLELQIDEPELRAYPWELLWDGDDHRPALMGGLIRRLAAPIAAPAAISEWPFRLLIVVGTDDGKAEASDQIGAEQEVNLLKRKLVDFGRSIDINRLLLPERTTLQATLHDYQPHVVHFIGHATFNQGTKRHCLVIESAASTWNWDTVGIQNDFKTAVCVPRLVFLNACRSGSDRESNLSLQQVFTDRIQAGVVIAMQADVRGDLASRFSQAFYGHALVGSQPAAATLPPVVEALREGRLALGADVDIDWGLPALTFGATVPVDFKLRARQTWPTGADFAVCRQFNDARVYADESDSRRAMIQWFYPIASTAQAAVPNILILRGPAASGKSRLLHWCMETWAASGTPMRHLAVDLPRGKNCLKWLIRLRAGELPKDRPEAERFLKAGLELAPFMPFYDAVARAANLMDGPDKIDDPKARVKMIDAFEREVADDVSVAPLCGRFLEGLQALGKLIVVFDQLSIGAIDPALFSGFRDAFLAPIGKRASAELRVVVAVTRDDYDKFGLAALDAQSARVVDLRANYTPMELEGLAVEALRYKSESFTRPVARLHLERPTSLTGLARLIFCENFLIYEDFRDLERMR